jgi:hypothetical protein
MSAIVGRIHGIASPRPVGLFLASLAWIVAAACSGTPGATTGPGGQAAPAGGGTTFHVVIADGPKAGTYDVSTATRDACAFLDEGWFTASYLETAKPGLDYVTAGFNPNGQHIQLFFDSETDAKIQFVGDEGKTTVNVDDHGSTATVTAVAQSATGIQEREPRSIPVGRIEVTVQCASVLRPGS